MVLLTGPVGGSRLGRHLRISPRVDEGAWLHARGARALMDVSDGLALDLSRIARASGVAIELQDVPVHRDARRLARTTGRPPQVHALTDGEDHELLAALPASAWSRIRAAALDRFPHLRPVGRVRAGSGLRVCDPAGDGAVPWKEWAASNGAEDRGGYVHE